MKRFAILLLLATMGCATAPRQENTAAEMPVLSPQEYKAAQAVTSDATLVDVRTPEEYASGHLQGAENSDYRGGEFAQDIQRWNKKKTYYLYCASGNRSGKAAKLMQEAGFKHVYSIGGLPALKEAGLPVTESTSPQP